MVSLHEASHGHAAKTTASRSGLAGTVVGNSQGSNYVKNQSSKKSGGFSVGSGHSFSSPSPIKPQHSPESLLNIFSKNKNIFSKYTSNSGKPTSSNHSNKGTNNFSFFNDPSKFGSFDPGLANAVKFASKNPVSTRPPSQGFGNVYGMPSRPTTSDNYVIENNLPKSFKSGYSYIDKGVPFANKTGPAPLAPQDHYTFTVMKDAEKLGGRVTSKFNSYVSRIPEPQNPSANLITKGAKHLALGVSDVPGQFIDMGGKIPYGLETMARDPRNASRNIGVGAGVIAAGMKQGVTEDPLRFIGQMVVGPKVGSKVLKVGKGAAVATAKPIGRFTGLTREKVVTYTQHPSHPLGSQSAMIESVLEKPTVSGARGFTEHFIAQKVSGDPIGIKKYNVGKSQYTPGSLIRKLTGNDRQYLTRNYGSSGRVSGGKGEYSTNVHGQYMTISPEVKGATLMEKVGGHFLEKGGGNVFSRRVHILEDIPTVMDALPIESINAMKSDFSKFGKIRPRLYKEMQRAAVEKSARIDQPVAIVSPKTAQGFYKPELETLLVFGSEKATRVTSSKFAGFTNKGTVVKKVRFGTQEPAPNTFFAAENAKYNLNKRTNYVKAMAEDMNRQIAELRGKAMSKPGQYGAHGSKHIVDVESQILKLRKESKIRMNEFDETQAKLAAEFHDSARIWGKETEPIPHDQAAGLAVKMGLIDDSVLKSLPYSKQMQISEAIMHHTDIRPGIASVAGLKTKLITRPSEFAKSFASADRLARAAEQGALKKGMVFPNPDVSPSLSLRMRSSKFMRDTSAELFPVEKGTPRLIEPTRARVKRPKTTLSKKDNVEYPKYPKTKRFINYRTIQKINQPDYGRAPKSGSFAYPTIPKINQPDYVPPSKSGLSAYPTVPKINQPDYVPPSKTKPTNYPTVPKINQPDYVPPSKTKPPTYSVVPKINQPNYAPPPKSNTGYPAISPPPVNSPVPETTKPPKFPLDSIDDPLDKIFSNKQGRGKKTVIKIKTASEMMNTGLINPTSVPSRSRPSKPNTQKPKRTQNKRRAKK